MCDSPDDNMMNGARRIDAAFSWHRLLSHAILVMSTFQERPLGLPHAVESQSFADLKAVAAWLRNDEAKLELAADVSSVIAEIRKASRTSALAKGFYNLIILNGATDFLNGQPVKLEECEVDHIFSASKYPAGTKNVFNLSVIHKDTNRKKSDKLPAEFLQNCLQSHGGDRTLLASTLRAHFISEDGIKAMEGNDLDAFLVARETALQTALAERLLTR